MSIYIKEQRRIKNFLCYDKENMIRFKLVLLYHIREYNNAVNKPLILMTLKKMFFINVTFTCIRKVSTFESPRMKISIMKQFIYSDL